MPDKFDEMADGMFMAYGITGIKRESLAAALRSTDAKAREDCRSIALRLHHEYRQGGHISEAYMCSLIAAEIGKTPAIREGADAPRGPIADEDGCCSSCGRGLVPCPACQGGDDA